MPPSQMEQEYTHKKFNYGHSHKKLGLRVRQREPATNENVTQPQMKQVKTDKPSKKLFRPYALDENNTPRKRKLSSSAVALEEYDNISVSSPQTSTSANNTQAQQQHQQQALLNIANNMSCPTPTAAVQSSDSSILSLDSYNIRLQRQRAALYMRYMAHIQQHNAAVALQTATGYPMGYPNVTAPIFNGC